MFVTKKKNLTIEKLVNLPKNGTVKNVQISDVDSGFLCRSD